MKSNRNCHERVLAAHRLIDTLSVIVGYCELGDEDAQPGTVCAKRFELIHDIASKTAKELSTHQCHLSELVSKSKRSDFQAASSSFNSRHDSVTPASIAGSGAKRLEGA